MSITLDELLMLVGRLDEGAGFDSARERFRRYLLERVVDVHAVRALIEQCQHAPGEQHHRALQDLVVLLGRCLGFDIRFASPLPGLRVPEHDGHWHSRLHLDIDVDVDQPSTAVPVGADVRSLTLSVVTPLHASRLHLGDISQADGGIPHPVSLQSLLVFADMMSAGRLSHEDVVRLIRSGVALDFLVHLLEGATKPVGKTSPPPVSPELRAAPGFWIAAIGTDQAATPEQFVELVIARRRILGVGNGVASQDAAQPGDRVCLYIPRSGVVGHARVRSIATGRSTGIRDAHRFSQVLHLEPPVLHMTNPVPIGEETLLRLRAAGSSNLAVHCLTRISREEFTGLAATDEEAHPEEAPSAESGTARAETPELSISAGDSRSRA